MDINTERTKSLCCECHREYENKIEDAKIDTAQKIFEELENLIYYETSPITTMAFLGTNEYIKFKNKCINGENINGN